MLDYFSKIILQAVVTIKEYSEPSKKYNHTSEIERQFLDNICLLLISYVIRTPLFSREIKRIMTHIMIYCSPVHNKNSEKLGIQLFIMSMSVFTNAYLKTFIIIVNW